MTNITGNTPADIVSNLSIDENMDQIYIYYP
jgi:hypothetical protein